MSRPRRALPPGDPPQIIAPLARGLEVLNAFGSDDFPLRNSEIARRTSIPPSSVSRITGSLVHLGYLDYEPKDQTYCLTPLVLRFGRAFLDNSQVTERLRSGMADIAQMFGATVALGARVRTDMIYVECQKGPSLAPFRFDVGSTIPLARSAMGWAYLSGLEEEAFQLAVKDIKDSDADLWQQFAPRIERAREDVRQRGFCISMGAFESGVHTVGVPVFIRAGGRRYGLTCGAPAYQLDESVLVAEIGPRLLWLARSVLQQADIGSEWSRG